MNEVKPVTVPIDDDWLRFAASLVEKPCPCCDADGELYECQHEIGCRGIRGLLARIESDRAEIARLTSGAAGLGLLLRAESQEVARLKAEVERLTPKCPVCLGHRTTTPAGNIPCQSCGGTGRAR